MEEVGGGKEELTLCMCDFVETERNALFMECFTNQVSSFGGNMVVFFPKDLDICICVLVSRSFLFSFPSPPPAILILILCHLKGFFFPLSLYPSPPKKKLTLKKTILP